ncbi:MAG: S8 family serine peptidase [Anaerolineae bacterium]|nr:S8 family serine peptidase [Anaerolineae bacterium]
MRRQPVLPAALVRLALAAFALAWLIAAGAGPTQADEPPSGGYRPERVPAPIDGEVTALPSQLAKRGLDPNRVSVILELQGEPAVETYRVAKQAGQSEASAAKAQTQRDAQLKAQQAPLVTAAKAAGATVIGQYTLLYNGVQVHTTTDRLDALAQLPGVVAIHAAPAYEPMLSHSVPFIGADQVRTQLGLDGTGVSIAIVDTGIDYTHRDFGGPGTEDAYNAAITDTKALTETYQGRPLFPTLKVVGGYDFVGDVYNPYAPCSDADHAAGLCSQTPEPDPDPIDVGGHGTHVAGIAAGFGVPNDSVNGSRPSTFDGTTIYHGVAPAAVLYAYKIFGAGGALSDAIALAVERAMDPNQDGNTSDHVNVVNMSLGASFAGADVLSQMSRRAAQVGVLVTAAAGNSGDIPYISGASAAGDFGLSVASSYASGQFANAVQVNSPAALAGRLLQATQQSWAPQLADTGPVTGDVVYVGRGCPAAGSTPEDPYLADPRGKIALIIRGTCAVSLKAARASAAGAIAVLVYDNVAGLLPPSFSNGGGTITVPTLTLTNESGVLLRNALTQGTVNVTMSNDVQIALTDVVSSFSSRGPDVDLTGLRPDITAPGSNIVSAAMGTGTQGVAFSGTSMATPHIAGALALMRQQHPDWSAQEISALLANTASPELYLNPTRTAAVRAPVSRIGSGRVDLVHAASTETVAYSPNYLGNVSFGFQAVVDRFNGSRPIRITNKSSETRTYDLSWTWATTPTTASLISVSLGQNSVTLAAGASVEVPLTLSLPAEALSPFGLRNQNAGVIAQLNRSEMSGFVQVTQRGGTSPDSIHVPFYFLGRRASDVNANATSLSLSGFGQAASRNIQLTNTSRYTGTTEVFALVATDPDEPSESQNVDIKNVGVRMDQGVLQFGINAMGPRAVALGAVYVIHLDTNRDGTTDWQLLNFDLGAAGGAAISGQNVSVLCPASVNVGIVFLNSGAFPDDCIPEYFTGFTMNSANTILSMDAADAGITGNAPLNFYITSLDYIRDYDRFSDRVPDSGWITFNPAQVRFRTDATTYTVRPNGTTNINVQANLRGFLGGDQAGLAYERGILLLHSDNTPGARDADIVSLSFPFQFSAFEQVFNLEAETSGYVSNRQLLRQNFGRFFGSPDLWTGEDTRSGLVNLGVVTFRLPAPNTTLTTADLDLTLADTSYLDAGQVEAMFGVRGVESANLVNLTYPSLIALPVGGQFQPQLDDDAIKGKEGTTYTFSLREPMTVRGSRATFLTYGEAQGGFGRAFVNWYGAGSAHPPRLRALGFTCTGGTCP